MRSFLGVRNGSVGWPEIVAAVALLIGLLWLPSRLFPAVVVRWQTETEIGSVGFNVLRAGEGDNDFRPVNDTLIPAVGSTTSGGRYAFGDRSARWGKRYIYRLQEINADGSTITYPARVVVRAGWPLWYDIGVTAVLVGTAGLFFVRGKQSLFR